MKKMLWLVLVFSILVGVTSPLYAGNGNGNGRRCQLANWGCGSVAYSICAERFKFYDPAKSGPRSISGWTVEPTTDEFKACEAEERAKCLKAKGCA